MDAESLAFDYIGLSPLEDSGDEVTNITFCQTVRSLTVLLRLQKARMEGATPAGADVVLSGSNREPAGIGELLDDGQLNLELSDPTRSRARSSTFPVLYTPYWSGYDRSAARAALRVCVERL